MQVSLNRTGRSRVLLLGLIVVGAIFIMRLFYLQVIKHDYYVAKAQETQVTKFTIPAKRGMIYAKDGSGMAPLVMNEPVYTVYADPSEVEEPEKVEALLRRVAGGDVRKGFEEDLQDKDARYTVLAKQVNKDQAQLIKQEELVGVGLQEQTRRVYPEGSLASQLLGFVNADHAGQYGIEGMLDDRLKGQPGALKAVTDVRRIPLTISNEYVNQPAKDGDTLLLTIDRNVQAYAEAALKKGLDSAKAKHGSVIVMDPTTGGVMAMANYPSYDPAKYSQVEDAELFQNKVVSDPYEAGSVIKTLTVGAGIDSGAVRADSTYNNTGSVQVADFLIKNATTDNIGTTSMMQILQFSLNTGVVHILKQMGGGEINTKAKETLYKYFTERYRFNKTTGIEQFGETNGYIAAPSDQDGGPVRYANMSFGQGMNVTMAQVTAAFAAAINGGTYYKPTLVEGVVKDGARVQKNDPQVVQQGVLSPGASQQLRDMVVTARQQGIVGKNDKKGYNIGGKTGTSQIIDQNTGKYIDDNSIGTYLGFGGDSTPRYVIMVRVQDSQAAGYAGTVAAAPIFGDISNWLLDYMQLQPTR